MHFEQCALECASKINRYQEGLSGPSRRGRKSRNLRRRIEAILWIVRTGAPWRDLPAWFGPWQSAYSSFRRWSKNGFWAAILGQLRAEHREDDAVLIDSTSVRVHQHGANPAGGQLAQAMAVSRASLSTKIHLACDSLGCPLGFILTGANVADCDQAKPLLHAYLQPTACAILDKGYDSDAIRAYVNQHGGVAVIAVHPNRAIKPAFDQLIYRERHFVENLACRLKAFRRISTRYDKLSRSFAAFLYLACSLIWLRALF